MYGCESWNKESWGPKNWLFLTVVLEKTLESPFDCKEIQPVHPKGDESCVFTGRTDVEGETPILWPPDVKNWLTAKDPDVGKIQGWKKRGWQRMRWLDGITKSMDMSLTSSKSWWWTGKPGMLQSMGSQRVGHDWATELNSLEGYHASIRKLQQLTNILMSSTYGFVSKLKPNFWVWFRLVLSVTAK